VRLGLEGLLARGRRIYQRQMVRGRVQVEDGEAWWEFLADEGTPCASAEGPLAAIVATRSRDTWPSSSDCDPRDCLLPVVLPWNVLIWAGRRL
jgi:hypothetical protein